MGVDEVKLLKSCLLATTATGTTQRYLGFTKEMTDVDVRKELRVHFPELFTFFIKKYGTSEEEPDVLLHPSGERLQLWYLCAPTKTGKRFLQVVLHSQFPNGDDIGNTKKKLGGNDSNNNFIFIST